MRNYVAVCGPHDASEGELEMAHAVGHGLAEAGVVVICGGLGGVMAAVARGARQAGGDVIGILPGSTRDGAATSLSFSIPTGLGEARNAVIVQAADVVIAVGGGPGTLSEIALAVRAGIPVIGLATWHFNRNPGDPDAIQRVSSPADAVERALAALDTRGTLEE